MFIQTLLWKDAQLTILIKTGDKQSGNNGYMGIAAPSSL